MLTQRLGLRILDQNRLLARMSRTDPIVELPNRPHFEERARAELERQRRSGRESCLLLIDVDRFKAVNDRHGHAMGDAVLKRIAKLLRDSVRSIDLPARYGGDEFAVLLVDTDATSAIAVAERIRSQAAGLSFDAKPGLRCTLSIGIASSGAGAHAALDGWIHLADAALYRAKAGGRNRIAGDAVD